MPELGRLITAMVTPFAADSAVDYASAKRLALALLDSGSEGVVVAGTTGESATLSRAEKLRLFEEIKQAVGDRGAVIANTGTNDTAESVELTREAERTGVDGILAVTPYYNRPPQSGLEQHFTAIAEATSLPVILYNVPGRTSVNLEAETTVRLSSVPNIAGIKEAAGDLQQVTDVIRDAAPGFRVWSGADEHTLAIVAAGGYGAISVVSHLVGRQVAEMIAAAAAGSGAEAASIHDRLLPLIEALFVVTSPIPLKYAMNRLGFPAGGVRLPLCGPDDATGERIMAEVEKHRIDLPVSV